MAHMTSVERYGRKVGRNEGIQNSIFDALEVRFGEVLEAGRASIESLESSETCSALHREAILAESMDAFEAKFADVVSEGA